MKNRILVLCLLPVLLLSGCGKKAPAETLPVETEHILPAQEEITEGTASEASLPEQPITMEEPGDSAATVPGKDSDTTAPTKPKETSRPTATTKPAQDKTPPETTKPAQEETPAETTQPAETVSPTEKTEPTEKPAETTEPPAETTKPPEETKPNGGAGNGGNVSPEWTPPVL